MLAFVIGSLVLTALYLLGQAFAVADPKSLAKVFRAIGAASFFLAGAGAFAIGRIVAAALLFFAAWMIWNEGNIRRRLRPARAAAMSRDEAYAVLGLAPGAGEDDIRAAYRKLILQNHPDRGGSEYLAAKINQARDVLHS